MFELRKYFYSVLFPFSLIIILYFFTRFFNLLAFPIFNDESTYIRFGLQQYFDSFHQPYSLLIGKEPLMPFLYGIFAELIKDRLLGARIVGILFGFVSVIGLFFLGKKIQGVKTGLFAALLYVLSPIMFFFDRFSLLDGPLITIFIWALLVTILLITTQNYRYAIVLGLLLSVGVWIKLTGWIFVGVSILSLGIFAINKTLSYRKMFFYITLMLYIICVLYLPLYTHHFYPSLQYETQKYTYPIFSLNIDSFLINFQKTISWIVSYVTIPVLFVVVYGFIKSRKSPAHYLITFWFIVPLVYELIFARSFTSRYALFIFVPLIVFASIGLYLLWIRFRWYVCVLMVIIMYGFFVNIQTLYFKPHLYPDLFSGYAKSDLLQYTKGFSSGFGVREAAFYLIEKSRKEKIVVFVRNDHGNPEDAIIAFLMRKKNIDVEFIPPDPSLFKSRQVKGENLYYVSRGAYFEGIENYLVLEKKFAKPSDAEYVGIYKMNF